MSDIKNLKGIGASTIKKLAELGVYETEDLLCLYPRRYDRFPYIQKLENGIEVQDGKSAIEATISRAPVDGAKNSIRLYVNSGGYSFTATWFSASYMERYLWLGRRCVFYGNVTIWNGRLQMVNPIVYDLDSYKKIEGAYVPVYPSRDGLSQKKIRELIAEAFNSKDDYPGSPIPEEIQKQQCFISKKDAVWKLHNPNSYDDILRASARIIYDEFYDFFIKINERAKSHVENVYQISSQESFRKMLQILPYQLTEDQMKAVNDIMQDMATPDHVANRLIQGDVGSGKTVVAFSALLCAADSHFQSALMAPTEVLAGQHYDELCKILTKIGLMETFQPVLLTGSVLGKARTEILRKIKSGEARIIVGTHALIQSKVEYENLGLAVIDEQHRFGVKQRESLLEKGKSRPHYIMMTATPIPRSLCMTLYGNMDATSIKTKPSNRLRIKTCVINNSKRDNAYSFIQKELDKGHQVYIICSMVDPSMSGSEDDLKAVVSHAEWIQEQFPDYKCIALHGQQKSCEKNQILEQFASGEARILVSTTVVEVGINVPNATAIMIEDANRFGLLQLHQLRGRVGRGGDQSYCIFLDSADEPTERLKSLVSTDDGFEIAEQDYKLRGSGKMLGETQSGAGDFALANPIRDENLMKIALRAVSLKEESS